MKKAKTDDLRIDFLKQLIAPVSLMEQLPASTEVAQFVSDSRKQCQGILSGQDDRLLVVVGPCSIHDTVAAGEYAGRLRELQETVTDDLFLVMRVYFEKTQTKTGWKGLINDPLMDESYRINKGLSMARELLLHLSEMGVPTGSEFLDAITPQYYGELVSWGAIAAPSTESQVHRELASGLEMPVGFKNGTSGNFQIAIDAIMAARQPHRFLSVTTSGNAAIVSTSGNQHCHIILRGGKSGPNFDSESVAEVCQGMERAELEPCIMLDCSHDNSGHDHQNQPKVCKDIAGQVGEGNRSIRGVMIESHLNQGNQKGSSDFESLKYGVSITDSCVNWDTTLEMIKSLSEAVQKRRAS